MNKDIIIIIGRKGPRVSSAFPLSSFRSTRESLETKLIRDWNLKLLANWISRWFRFWPIRAQAVRFVIFQYSFRPLSRGLRYSDFVSFGPHCLVFVFLYLILSSSTQNVSKRYLLFHKALRRYRRIRIQVRAVRCLYNWRENRSYNSQFNVLGSEYWVMSYISVVELI